MPATIDYFYKNKSSPDKINTYCKKCSLEKFREWKKNNYEQWMVNQNKNFQTEKWKASNVEAGRRFRASGKFKDWQRNNKDKVKIYNSQHQNHEITEEQWEECKQFFNFECCYCGISEEKAIEKYKNKLHKDHINPEGSNGIDNCTPACKTCNSSKGNKDMIDWFVSRKFFDENRLEKIFDWFNYINRKTK